MSAPRLASTFLVLALLAAACADDDASEESEESEASGESDESEESEASGESEPPGLIVSTGDGGVSLSDESGEILATVDGTGATTQPTWSRDGRRFVSSVVDERGEWSVEVRGGADGDLILSAPATRSYFFFSWRHDGERIAALGPGRLGTTLDILDGDGVLITGDVVEGGTVFLAWEPDGSDLLVHRDTDMLLLPGGDDPVELGSVGFEFRTPAWLPGSRDALVMVTDGTTRRLRRVSVDGPLDGENLGEGFPASDIAAWIIVDAAGELAAVVGADDPGGITTAAYDSDGATRPVQSSAAATVVVDLATGGRQQVIVTPVLWAEWSPDGQQLLVASLAPGADWATWSTWANGELTEIVEFVPTPTFLADYMVFGDQYVEQPRLWAPDGSAFTFGGRLRGGDRGVVVVGVGEYEPELTIDGASVAFWSPGDPGS